MTEDRIFWEAHRSTLEPYLQRWQAPPHKPPPVILLSGPAGSGKAAVARTLAQWLLCANFAQGTSPGAQPCDICPACRQVLSGNSVQLREIGAEDESGESSTTIKIDELRELKRTQGFAAAPGSFQVFLLSHAERMTPQAANSVLKLFEEPPAGWVFILTSENLARVMPTILSRAFAITLPPLSLSTLRTLAAALGLSAPDQSTPTLEDALVQAFGSHQRLKALLSPELRPIHQALTQPGRGMERAKLIDALAEDSTKFEFAMDTLEAAIHARVLGARSRASDWDALDEIYTLRRMRGVPLNRKLAAQRLVATLLPTHGA